MNKKLSRLPAIIMSLVVLSGMLPMLSASISAQFVTIPPSVFEISNIEITGVTEPVLGKLPTTKGIATTSPVNIVYKADGGTCWMERINPKVLFWSEKDPTKPFVAGMEYSIRVVVSKKEAFYFGEKLTATVNGKKASDVLGSSDVRYIFLHFSPLSAEIVNVDITGVTPPEAGKLPTVKGITTKTPGVTVDLEHTYWREDVDGYWNKKDVTKPFEPGKKYSIRIVVDRGGEYVFADKLTATVNGKTASKIDKQGTYSNIFFDFPPLAEKVKMIKQPPPWTKGSGKTASFTSSAEFKDFLSVNVDGKKINASNYEVKNGSTIVTFKAAFLETLSVGKHKVEVISKPGTAVGNLEILSKSAPVDSATESPDADTSAADTTEIDGSQTPEADNAESSSAQTEDGGGSGKKFGVTAVLGIAVIFIIILLVIIVVVLLLKKKK